MQEERLREINSRLTTITPLWESGHTQSSVLLEYAKSKEELETCREPNMERFIQNGGNKMPRGTVRMQLLLNCIDVVERIHTMKGQDPSEEIATLLESKLRLLETMRVG